MSEIETVGNKLMPGVISTVVWSIVTLIAGAVISNQAAILAWILQICPDSFDQVAEMTFGYVIALIMLFIGPGQQKKVGASVQKLWK